MSRGSSRCGGGADAAGGEVGTSVTPHRERTSSFKLWLRYPKPSHGTEVSADGEAIGKGIVNYSAGELRQIKGMRSGRITSNLRELGRAPVLTTRHCD